MAKARDFAEAINVADDVILAICKIGVPVCGIKSLMTTLNKANNDVVEARRLVRDLEDIARRGSEVLLSLRINSARERLKYLVDNRRRNRAALRRLFRKTKNLSDQISRLVGDAAHKAGMDVYPIDGN